MAITGNDLLSKLEERKKKKKEESQGSTEGVTGEQLLKKYETHKRYKTTDTSGVDEKYLNTFMSDANSFFSGVGDYSISYTDANSRLQDLGSRYDTIQAYLYQNKGKLDEKSYSSLSSAFDDFTQKYNGAAEFYGKFENEDSYNAWKSRKELLSGVDSDPEFDSKSSTGWSKYLSDKEARANEALYGKEDETFWEKLGRWMGSGGAVDTSLPMGTATQVQHDLREDDSPLGPTNDWTDEQKAIYGYLYETDRAAAEEYAKYATEDNELEAIKRIQENATSSLGAGILNTAGAIATAPMGMADFLNDLVKQDFSDDGTISPFEYSQAVTEGISTHLNEKGGTLDEDIPIIGDKGWGDVYGLGTSIIQSMASAYTLGPGGTLVAYFGQGAAAGADEAKKRGAEDWQATLYGMAVGVFEGIAESLGIDNLFKLGGTTTLKGVILNILKQAGAEGAEEGLTALFSNIADNAIMGDKSTFYALVNQYMASGMSESDAKTKAWLDSVEGIAYDTIAGAASGGVSGGIHTTTQSVIDNAQANKLYGNSAMELTQEALELDQDNKFAQKMYDRLDSGKTLSGAQLNRLAQHNQDILVGNDVTAIQSATEERLKSLGETGDVTAIAKALTKWVQGQELSNSEKKAISNSKFGKRVANELNPENIRSGGYSSAWAEKIGTDKIHPAEYGKALSAEENVANVTENASAHDIAVQAILGGAESIPETDKVEENVEVKEIASVKDGEVMVRLDGGEVVNAREANLSTETEGLLYEAVAQMSADPDIRMDAVTANDFVKGYDPKAGVSVGEYIHGFKDAYLYGAYGFAETELERGVFTSRLTDIQRRTAHGHGKMVGQERVAEKQAKIDSTVANKTEKDSTSARKKGKVYRDFGAAKALNARQKTSLKALEVVAESLGVDIHVFESKVGKDGKRVGANGWFDPADNSIHIDLYAGSSGESTMLFTASHELTHFIREWSPAKFKTFADFLLEQYGEKGVPVEQLVQSQIEKAKRNGRDIDFDTAYEEVVADACETMLTDSNAMEKIALLKAKDKSLWSKIKSFIQDLMAKINEVYKGLKPDSLEANYVREMKDAAERLQALWTDALADAGTSFQEASALVEIDTDTDSVAPMFSERTWTESEYVTERELTAKKISKDLGVDLKTAYKYIDDINSVARLIADDRARLDYEPNLDSKATVIKPNSDYKWSVDMSTLCAKRLLFTGTFDALQRMFPNTAFDSDDIVRLRSMMEERGYEVACGICYVESTRREIGTITADFIERYKEAQKTGKPITRINSEGKVVELKKTKDQMETTVDKSSDRFFTEKGYTPTLAELNTTDIDLVKKDHPLVYEAYLNFMNARGQAKPKLLETRAEYKGEILKHFKYASAVKSRNNAGGLRLQSFSDFEVPHLIDMMQIVMDMARVGLKSQAYTKVPSFAEAFGNTGIKINLSLIAKGTGLDSNGNLVFDDVEGINHKEAFRLRDKFSENVGTILVGKNNAHIIAAMADPRIDYIIPFHKSSWKESLYDALGLVGYDDYTDTQHEKPLDKDRKISDFDPSEYWDFSKTGDENAQIYLEKCRQDGRIPKFPQFQGYPGYWKLLIDFKMYDNDGVGAPQNVVQPIFDDAVNQKILREYQGGHRSFPVAKDVVEDFAKEYESKVSSAETHVLKYSERNTSDEKLFNPEGLSLDEQLDDILHSAESFDGRYLYIGRFTDDFIDMVKQYVSINDLPVAMNYRDAYLSMESRDNGKYKGDGINYHNLGKEGLKSAIEAFDRPEQVLLSKNNGKVELILEGIDKKGNKLLSVVELNTVARNAKKYIEAHIVTSIYGKRSIDRYISKAEQEGRLIYNKKEESTQGNSQVQYEGIINANSSKSSIAQDSDSVKRKFSDRETTTAEDFVAHMRNIVQNRGAWYRDDVQEYVAEHPELNFIERIFAKDKAAKSDLEAFLAKVDNVRTLDDLSWYMSHAYADKAPRWGSNGRMVYPYRGAVTTFKNAIKRRVNEIMTAKVNGTNIGAKNGDVSLEEVKDIFYRLNHNEEIGRFAEKVFATAETLGVNIRFVNQTFAKGVAGDNVGDMIEYKTSYFNDTAVPDQRKASTILHELIHVCTVYVMHYNTTSGDVRYGSSKTANYERIANAATRLNRIYGEIKNDPAFRGQYGITNAEEMVAELANERFVGLLKEKNLWDRIVDWICELFGFSRGTSAYDNAMQCLDYILDNPEISEYKQWAAHQRRAARRDGYDVFGRTVDENGVKYSDRDSYAPTFYSHMGKVVDGIKSEKVGAAGVVPYLKGKGVKAEEIKWSGIEAWLEGKKSVTKAELQEFVAGSQLQIEEQVSDRDIELRYDHSTDSYTVIDGSGEVIDTYTYNADLGGYASENDDEVYEYASDLEKEMRWAHGTDNAPKHSQYKIEGGENYRELIFAMPNASYSNNAMRVHWGEDAAGVLAHARIQDITTADGGKMLFVEEIQSDWHNEGAKEGYSDSRDNAKLDALEDRANELFLKVEDYSTKMTGLAGEWETIEQTAEGAKLLREYREAQAEYERVQDDAIHKIPDAPFRNNYHEYVLKRLIRMAAEEGYDSIGWTTAEMQSDRWSERYAEGYRIEYDQDIPSFLRKYGKKWGAKVGKTALPNLPITKTFYDVNREEEYGSLSEWEKVVRSELKAQGLPKKDLANLTIIEHKGNMVAFDAETGKEYDRAEIRETGNEVWSMDIPAAMKNSVLYEGQAMYQDRDPDSVSTRSLLAGALDSVAQNDIERNKLAQYKQKIELIQSEERELHEIREQIKELSFAKGPKDTAKIRSLQDDATRIANRINTYDRQLLTLEASKPLKAVLEREKALAYKKAEKKGKEALARYKEKAADTQRELMTRYQESRKKGVESRHKTEMRHKIKDVVSELNQYLLRGTKDHHVPIELQKAVAEALDAVNMDTVGANERIAKLNLEMMIAKTPEKVQEISRKIDHIKEMGDRMDGKLKRLKEAYDKFTESDDPLIANSHDEVISSKIQSVIESVGSTPLRDMTLTQLEDVYDMYRMVLTTVRNANKAFKAKKNESIAVLGNRVMMEVDQLGGKKKAFRRKGADFLDTQAWNTYKPVFAFERIGSKTLSGIYNNVRAGEDVWATDVTEAKEFYREQTKKYKYDSWDFGKRYDFRSTSGKDFSLSLDQIMSLYAYSKREQAAEHLKRGGIVFDESTEVTMKTKLGIKVKFNPMEATAYNLSDQTLASIIGKLTEEQKAFVDVMQDYLSTTMGAKGNEVSLELYGIKLFKEKHYFPLKSAPQFMAIAKEQQQGTVKIKNSGFSKETVQKASNPIVLTPFMDVWSNHVNEMSMYHAFVLPMEDFYRVYNYKTPTSDTMATESVEMFIQNAYGKGATQYIDQLLKDLNGGARTDPRAGVMNTLIGKFKKSAVFASLSVVVQQPSAIARALSLVDAKYFVGKMTLRKHSVAWEEVKKYAPVAIIKEMGYFDTNMGMQTTEWMTTKEYHGLLDKAKALFTDSGFRDEALSKGPALADELAWCYIWEAVKRETRATTKLQPGTEEFLAKAGERFTEVVTKTQVYDSVLARSGFMRSKDSGVKMATAFMAEPTTSLNMIADAIVQGKRGSKAYAAKTIGSVVASMIINSVLVSFVYAVRDDDEDKTYIEKYFGTLTEELLDGINPLTLIPFAKDIVSIFQGYDVERSDMAVITDLIKAWRNLSSESRTPYRKIEDFAGAIASIFGLPVKNIMRDARGIYNTFRSFFDSNQTTGAGIKTAVTEAVTGKEKTNSEKLYDAMVSGDSTMIDRVENRYKDQDAFELAVRQALRGEYEEGDLSDSQAVDMLVDYGGKAEDEAIAMVMYWAFKQDNPDTYVDDSWISEYYADGIAAAGISVETFVEYRNTVKDITGEGKKERRMAIIHSLPITNAQKDALYLAEGWTESRLYEAPWH